MDRFLMKCHYCDQTLGPAKNQTKWDLSCPSTHCHVKLKDGVIDQYRVYLYPNKDLRYTIECRFYYEAYHTNMASHTKIPHMIRNKKGKMVKKGVDKKRKTLINVKRQIPITLDDNGKLEVQKVFEKLQLFVLFS